MEELTLNGEVLSALAGLPADELKDRLTSEDGEIKQDAGKTFAQIVTGKFKAVEKERAENQYKRGLREKGESIEKVLKPIFEKFEIKDFSKAEEAIQELTERLNKQSTGGDGTTDPQQLTEDELKKLPIFQQALDKAISKKDEAIESLRSEYDKYKTTTERQRIAAQVRDKAATVLKQKKAAFGEDEAGQLDFFFKAVGYDNFRVGDDGIELVDSDGNPLRDQNSNRITFDNYIVNQWKKAGYTFHDAPPGSGSAGAQRGGKGGDSSIVINSPEHYNQLIDQAGNDWGKRAKIMKAWAKQQAESE